MKRHFWIPSMGAAWFLSFLLMGCGPQQGAPPPSIPEVAVVTVQPQKVPLTTELPGRTCAYLIAEIRPQVNGQIQEQYFPEGNSGKRVEKGQPLFKIDPAPFQAALEQAKANLTIAEQTAERAESSWKVSVQGLERHKATLALAQSNLKRVENLVVLKATSATEHDQAKAEFQVAEATLKSAEEQMESDRRAWVVAKATIEQAKAALKTAKINLDYTEITAPIDGRIGRSNVTKGAIVTAYQPMALATIHSFHPIYVDVPQSTSERHRLRDRLANGGLKKNGAEKVKIVLPDGSVYRQEGLLRFHEVQVDPTTGSVILRIEVPNPREELFPGMFVRAVIEEGIQEKAILIPQQAVSRDLKGNPIALVVDAEEKVKSCRLTIDRAQGDKWLITKGLSQGDRVIVEGTQKARPGMTVKVVPFEAGQTPAAKPEGTAQASTH